MMLFFWKFSYLTQEFLKLESDLDLKQKQTWKYQTSNFLKLEKTNPGTFQTKPKVFTSENG